MRAELKVLFRFCFSLTFISRLKIKRVSVRALSGRSADRVGFGNNECSHLHGVGDHTPRCDAISTRRSSLRHRCSIRRHDRSGCRITTGMPHRLPEAVRSVPDEAHAVCGHAPCITVYSGSRPGGWQPLFDQNNAASDRSRLPLIAMRGPVALRALLHAPLCWPAGLECP